MDNSLKNRFLQFVLEQRLVSQGDRVLAAVSGGVDSVVLLRLLYLWRDYFDLSLGIAHFNHQLRGEESEEDESFVKELAKRYQLPVFVGRGDVRRLARRKKYSLEEAARLLREEFLEECRQRERYSIVATGHNLNDQAETILMHLLSGAGIEGLAGIRLRREAIVRPLLFASREDIQEFARASRLCFRSDSSNDDLRYLRNRIRHRLLPLLQQDFGLQNLDAFYRLGSNVQEWLPLLEAQIQECLSLGSFQEAENKIRLDIPTYQRYFSAIQIRVLEALIARLTGKAHRLSFNKFSAFAKWLGNKSKGGTFLLHKGVRVRRSVQALYLEIGQTQIEKVDLKVYLHESYSLPGGRLRFRIEEVAPDQVSYSESRGVEYIDARQITFPLTLRNWRPGDRFQPLGAKYQKKISDYLTDQAQLIFSKRQMLVLTNRAEIVAIVGCQISDRYKCTPQTEKVLALQLD